MLIVIQDMYTGKTATELVDNCQTQELEIHSGVLQGRKIGTHLFSVLLMIYLWICKTLALVLKLAIFQFLDWDLQTKWF